MCLTPDPPQRMECMPCPQEPACAMSGAIAHLAGHVGGLGNVLELDVLLAGGVVVDARLHRLQGVAGGGCLRPGSCQR